MRFDPGGFLTQLFYPRIDTDFAASRRDRILTKSKREEAGSHDLKETNVLTSERATCFAATSLLVIALCVP